MAEQGPTCALSFSLNTHLIVLHLLLCTDGVPESAKKRLTTGEPDAVLEQRADDSDQIEDHLAEKTAKTKSILGSESIPEAHLNA